MRSTAARLAVFACAFAVAGCRTDAPAAPPATPSAAFGSASDGADAPAPSEPSGPAAVPWKERPRGRLSRCPRSVPAPAADAPCPRWTFDAELGVFSSYVWRGLVVGDEPVLQGSVTASRGGFSFNVWGNVDLTDVHDTELELNEINLTPSYTHRVTQRGLPLDVSMGSVAYLFPVTDDEPIWEVYAGVSADVLLRPSLTVWYELLDLDYTYVTFDVGHTFECRCFGIDLAAGVGWGNARWHAAYVGVPGRGWNDVTLSAAAVIPRGRWTITPKVWWSSLLREDLRQAVATPDAFVAAIVLSASF